MRLPFDTEIEGDVGEREQLKILMTGTATWAVMG